MAHPGSTHRLRDLLLRAGVVDEVQMRAALRRLEQFGGRLTMVLSDMGRVDDDAVALAIGTALRLPVQDLRAVPGDPEALARLDARLCEAHGVFPVSFDRKRHTLTLAMADPTALDVVDQVAARADARVQTVVASEAQVAAAIELHYHGRTGPLAPEPSAALQAPAPVVPEGDGLPPELDRDFIALPAEPGGPAPINAHIDPMLGKMGAPSPFSAADLDRLEHLRKTQEKTATVVRALEALLREKGYRT
jgi:hypothetical protein